MNVKRLWCVLVIIAFSMPALAAVPGQIDSFDDINDTNWVETTGNYMEQALVGGANEVNEGTGSMKFDFNDYVWPNKDDDAIRTFNPALDFSNYKDLAITLWVWTDDPNDSRRLTWNSRLNEISLYDGSDRGGHFSVLPLKNIGWNKVIAPLRNFAWYASGSPIHPNEVDWDDITKIGLWARTEDVGDHNAIYVDDMQLEWAPPQPARPYQLASCDDINDELWDETKGTNLMLQALVGGANEVNEGTGSMMIDFVNYGGNYDITPSLTLIPALDFTDGNDWAVTVWVWTDLVQDSYLWEIILHDVAGNTGRYRVPRADINTGYGWNKITARIDELLWGDGSAGGGIPSKLASEVCLDAILSVDLYAMNYPHLGNNIYLDDLRIEPAVKGLSEAVVYNADYGTITVDGNAADWASLVDSDPIDFDLTTINFTAPPPATWPHTGAGDLHVKYRLAWDPNYLYILVEEQPGDTEATEAGGLGDLELGGINEAGTYFDALALAFDFTNNRLPGVDVQLGLWLFLGLSSDERTDLMMSMLNTNRSEHNGDAITNGSVATSGTLGSRVIEARLKWTDLDSAIDSWFQPAGGIEAVIEPGYIFGCDPRLLDKEDTGGAYTALRGMGWFSGVDDPVGWPQGYYRWPTGRDTFSTDIRLVCSTGDLDGDCDVDFVDYAQFAAEWLETGCNNVNDFCNGADIIIDGAVILDDLARFTERWLD